MNQEQLTYKLLLLFFIVLINPITDVVFFWKINLTGGVKLLCTVIFMAIAITGLYVNKKAVSSQPVFRVIFIISVVWIAFFYLLNLGGDTSSWGLWR